MICPQIDLACHETVFVKRRNIFQIFSLCLPLCVWPNFVHSLHCTANSKVNFARLLLATLHSQQQQWQQQLPSLTRVWLKRVLSSLDKDAIIWDSTVIYPPDQNVYFKENLPCFAYQQFHNYFFKTFYVYFAIATKFSIIICALIVLEFANMKCPGLKSHLELGFIDLRGWNGAPSNMNLICVHYLDIFT